MGGKGGAVTSLHPCNIRRWCSHRRHLGRLSAVQVVELCAHIPHKNNPKQACAKDGVSNGGFLRKRGPRKGGLFEPKKGTPLNVTPLCGHVLWCPFFGLKKAPCSRPPFSSETTTGDPIFCARLFRFVLLWNVSTKLDDLDT